MIFSLFLAYSVKSISLMIFFLHGVDMGILTINAYMVVVDESNISVCIYQERIFSFTLKASLHNYKRKAKVRVSLNDSLLLKSKIKVSFTNHQGYSLSLKKWGQTIRACYSIIKQSQCKNHWITLHAYTLSRWNSTERECRHLCSYMSILI